MKRLYVFDIDRTIKPWFSDIPPLTKKAITLLQEKYIVALATGRAYSEAKAVCETLNIPYLICNGGSDVYIDGQLVYQNAPDFSKELISLQEKNPIHFFVADHGVFSYRYPQQLKKIAVFKHLYPKISSIYGLINMMGQVQKVTDGLEMGTLHKFYVFGKYDGTLDYQHIGSFLHTFEYENKAVGISWLIEYFNGFDEVIAFGDSRNDLTMFDLANRCYANKKGNKQLQAKANGLFNIKDGIYKIVLKELDV